MMPSYDEYVEINATYMEDAKRVVCAQFPNSGVIPIIKRSYQLVHEEISSVDTGDIQNVLEEKRKQD